VRVPAWSARVPVQQSWRGCVLRGLAGRSPGAHRRSWASAASWPDGRSRAWSRVPKSACAR